MAKKSQHPDEIAGLMEVMKGSTSILEIGSRYGEALKMFASVAAPAARIVSVELAGGMWGRPDSLPVLQETMTALKLSGFDTKLILGDSHDRFIQEVVRDNTPESGYFDFVFIDGDHTFNGIRDDFAVYHPMGRIVAFHDIAAWGSELPTGEKLGVPEVWEIVRQLYPHKEMIHTPKDMKPMGIGVLYVEAGRNDPEIER